ncbi:hypothetical protein [Dechloromonas sp.]|uniref:hypothetical protein n=1 Tax=Dechloromonas sp. TaxID=1917218 RepID=UPI00286E7C7A|nr:hypothetical protein [Dechloromonas sp.]
MIKRIFLILAILGLGACDQVGQKLGLEDPAKKEAKTEQEAKAVGSACRQSGRAIEDCYAIYSWLPKAGIYTGWREMDEYMRENKLETIAPQLPPPEGPGSKKKKKTQETASESETKAETKAEAKAEAKAEPEPKAEKH